MLSKKGNGTSQLHFYSTFEEQLSRRHPLYILANQMQWQIFEEVFKKHMLMRPSSQTHPFNGIVADA